MVRPSGYGSSSGPTVAAAWAVYFLTSLALVGEGPVLQQHLLVAALAGSFEDLERLVQVPVPFCVWLAWRFISRRLGMAFGLLGRLDTSGSGLLFATSFGRVVSARRHAGFAPWFRTNLLGMICCSTSVGVLILLTA